MSLFRAGDIRWWVGDVTNINTALGQLFVMIHSFTVLHRRNHNKHEWETKNFLTNLFQWFSLTLTTTNSCVIHLIILLVKPVNDI